MYLIVLCIRLDPLFHALLQDYQNKLTSYVIAGKTWWETSDHSIDKCNQSLGRVLLSYADRELLSRCIFFRGKTGRQMLLSLGGWF